MWGYVKEDEERVKIYRSGEWEGIGLVTEKC